jgi:hypothetical protein
MIQRRPICELLGPVGAPESKPSAALIWAPSSRLSIPMAHVWATF